MFTATLLTDPARPTLDRTTVESLRNAWGGGEAVWLDPGVAAEFPLPERPGNLWQVWEALQARHQKRDVQNMKLLSQNLLFEAALKMHDGVKSQRTTNQYCHEKSYLR
jgi:hypothetical protein